MADDHSAAVRSHWAGLQVDWKGRTALAADWLKDARSVADVGCGIMTLERYLPASTTYIPMDIVPRDERTTIVDLNKGPIPRIACDVLVLLGVLEYVDDLPLLLSQLNQYSRTVFSYNHFSLNDVLWMFGLRKKTVTWRNRVTLWRLRRLIKNAGLRIERQRRVRIGERLYEVVASPPDRASTDPP